MVLGSTLSPRYSFEARLLPRSRFLQRMGASPRCSLQLLAKVEDREGKAFLFGWGGAKDFIAKVIFFYDFLLDFSGKHLNAGKHRTQSLGSWFFSQGDRFLLTSALVGFEILPDVGREAGGLFAFCLRAAAKLEGKRSPEDQMVHGLVGWVHLLKHLMFFVRWETGFQRSKDLKLRQTKCLGQAEV